MAKVKKTINLLRGHQKGFLDKFLQWALTVGRVLIILTETIALISFLYRFSLDRQLVDLHDKIKFQQAIISQSKKNEDNFRNVHSRLKLAKSLDQQANETLQFFEEVVGLARGKIVFKTFSLSETSIIMEGQVSSSPLLKDFISSLRQHQKVQSVSLDKVENRTADAVIVAGISVKLKAKK